MSRKTIKVAITGAAGNIGYALAFRIAAGNMLGSDQPIRLQLVDIEPCEKILDAVAMELVDCNFPLLDGLECTVFPSEAFQDSDYALLVGARPRGKGMERKDLLSANGKIFQAQGRSLNDNASRDVRVVVIGNPANTNALIALHNAPDLNPRNFSCMTRLDHNRGVAMLAEKTGIPGHMIDNMTIWGNHSATQFPDLSHCTAGGEPALDLVGGQWWKNTFVPEVRVRGARVIEARGASSAASAASSIIDHVRILARRTPKNDWTSMGVLSENAYGITPGLIFSFPVTTEDGSWQIVENLEHGVYAQEMLQETERELIEERDDVAELLN